MAGEVDIATLGIKVDASTADTAAPKLDNLADKAERLETSAKGAASGSMAMQAAIAAAVNAINANTAALGNLTTRTETYRSATTGAGAATGDMDARVSKLKASLDPMGAAIDRVNAELAEARTLFEAGAMSAEQYARAQIVLNARSADFVRRQGMMNAAMGIGARSAKLQAHETLNLSRQFADIGVTAAMGMNPLMILIQQGPQIADVLQTARARGISAGQAFRQMGQMIMPWVTRLAPFLAAGAVAMAGLGLATRELNKDVGDVQKEFNLTEKQMERLKDKGTELGYTMGDVMKGLGFAIKGAITDAWGKELDLMEKWWNDTLDYILTQLLGAVKEIGGSFVGAFYVIKATWSTLPAAIGDVAIQAANFVINAVNKMAQKSADAINGLINSLPDWMRPNVQLKVNPIAALDNPNAGAASRDMTQEFGKGREAFGRGVDRFGQRWREGAANAREERIREDAGDPEAGRKPKKAKESDAEKDWKKAIEGAREYTKALREQTEEIGKNQFEVKRLQTERKAAELQAAAQALGTASAIAQAAEETINMRNATEAWIDATNSQKIKDMKRELQDEAEALRFEQSLLSMNSEERLRAMKIREISIRILEAERDGHYGVAEALRAEAQALANIEGDKGAREDRVDAAKRATEALREMNDGIREATESFGELFGTAGEGFANLLETMMDFNERQAESQERLIEIQNRYIEGQQMSAADAEEYGRIQASMAQAQIAHYGNMLSAAKTFFKEGSTGWKILEGAERLYRLFQFAMAIRAMFMDKAQTASSVANSGARAAADGVAAVAKAIASLPFPLNLVAGAATLAFLVGIGVKMFGGGKGSGGGGSGSASSEKLTEQYKGPRDQYGAPTSYYSVLRPGATTVANGGGVSSFPANASGGVSVQGGDIHLTVQGNMVRDTMDELVPILNAHQQATVEQTRQAVAADQNARAQRQTIGGGWG